MLNFFRLPSSLQPPGPQLVSFSASPFSRMESIQMQTTFGWHQRKKEVFADVEEGTENIFQIKGLNYCMGFEKFCRQCRHAIVCSSEQASLLFQKGGEKTNNLSFLAVQSLCNQAAIYILKFFALSGVWVSCLGPTIATLILEFQNFGAQNKLRNKNRLLTVAQQQCSYTNLPLFFLHSQRSIRLIHLALLKPFICHSPFLALLFPFVNNK